MTMPPAAISRFQPRGMPGLKNAMGALLLGFCLLGVSGAQADEVETEEVPGARAGAPTLASYDGHWLRMTDETDEANRAASIDAALSELSWIVRRMATGVLKKSTVPPEQIDFAWDGAQLSQIVNGRNGDFTRVVKFGAEPEMLKDSRGEDFTSHWTWTESGLQINWVQHQAYGSNLYRFDEENQTLVVEHRIHVTAISDIAPIVYHSRFGRDDLPAVSSAQSVKVSAERR